MPAYIAPDYSLNKTEAIPFRDFTPVTPNRRQQSKLIAATLRRNDHLLGLREVNLNPGEREVFLRRIKEGSISRRDIEQVISGIKTPLEHEEDPKNPTILFNKIRDDRRMRGLIAFYARGNFQERDSVTADNLYRFLSEVFPNAVSYQKGVGEFLDRIERVNGMDKRREYEAAMESFGAIAYGKQWEYLKQAQLLNSEATGKLTTPAEALIEEAPKPLGLEVAKREYKSGTEQAKLFNAKHRLEGKVMDGYKDGGRAANFDMLGRLRNVSREVIVVDRSKDIELQRMIQVAHEVQARYGNGLRCAFELAKVVHHRMHHPNAVEIVSRDLDSRRGQEILLGSISIDNRLAGVCRHRSLLFQVLAGEIGLKSALVRGNYSHGAVSGGHAWNEFDENGKRYVIDIMNPPAWDNFQRLDWNEFIQKGGFPEVGKDMKLRHYLDINNRSLY
jgi:hypothetical protein